SDPAHAATCTRGSEGPARGRSARRDLSGVLGRAAGSIEIAAHEDQRHPERAECDGSGRYRRNPIAKYSGGRDRGVQKHEGYWQRAPGVVAYWGAALLARCGGHIARISDTHPVPELPGLSRSERELAS